MEGQFSCDTETKTLEIESFLSNSSYLSGGPLPGAQDSEIYFSLKGAPDQSKYPNFFYWYSTLSVFNPLVIKSWGAKKEHAHQHKKPVKEVKEEAPKQETPKTEAPKSDDVDLFGDDVDEEEAARIAKKKQEEEDKKKAKVKAPIIAKSVVIFDVKIIDEEQDLDALAQKILQIEMDGLLWKTEFKKIPVAYNIKKLRMGCTIEDDKVLTDDLFDKILAWEEEVQSVDIFEFQKV